MSSDDDQESRVNVIPMDSFASDGDMSTWPGHPYAERNDQKWRELLARNWLAKMGSLETGEFTRGSFMPLLFFIYRALVSLLHHCGFSVAKLCSCLLLCPVIRALKTKTQKA